VKKPYEEGFALGDPTKWKSLALFTDLVYVLRKKLSGFLPGVIARFPRVLYKEIV
jgi:hypothetical protein